jgi:hypothetical protein
VNPHVPRKLIAASLSLILVSCSATRYAVPTDDELSQFVLVIKDSPDGQISHSWQRAEDFIVLAPIVLVTTSPSPVDSIFTTVAS